MALHEIFGTDSSNKQSADSSTGPEAVGFEVAGPSFVLADSEVEVAGPSFVLADSAVEVVVCSMEPDSDALSLSPLQPATKITRPTSTPSSFNCVAFHLYTVHCGNLSRYKLLLPETAYHDYPSPSKTETFVLSGG